MSASSSEVTVVVLNYNGLRFLDQCLRALQRQTVKDLRILVVDNGSTDGSVAHVQAHYPDIEVVETGRNLGYSGGNNVGAIRAISRFLFFLNNDAVPDADAIQRLADHLRANERVAACQPKIRSLAHPDRFDYAGGSGGYIDIFGYPFCRGRIGEVLEPDRGQYDDGREVFWASGAALMVRREAFAEIGGFDDSFFLYADEIDLCWRAWLYGWRVEVLPAAVVYHVGGGTLHQGSPLRIYYHLRNSLGMFVKNLRPFPLFALIPVRVFLDLALAAFFAARRQWSHASAVGRAYVDLVPMLPNLVRHRRAIQRGRRLTDREMFARMYPKSIALCHVLRRVQTFVELGWPLTSSPVSHRPEAFQRSN
ncbi:MAG: glycosyltransferase family 2 protein [Methanobacteriota archaeon]|nr:MAG: glycosyltransferase family 2 protein [Euryarchaeota archaeon]